MLKGKEEVFLKIFKFNLLILAGIFLFSIKLYLILSYSLIVFWILSLPWKRIDRNLKPSFYILPIAGLIFSYAISMLWTNDLEAGYNNLETKVSLIILFSIICIDKEIDRRFCRKVLQMITLSLILTFFLLILESLKMNSGYISCQIRDHLIWRLKTYSIHRSDLTIITFLLIYYYCSEILYKLISRKAWIIVIVLMLIALTISSRVGFLFFITAIPLFLIYRYSIKPYLFNRIYLFLLMGSLLFLLLLPGCVKDLRNMDDRIIIWNVATELLKTKPLFGYGVGDVQEKLNLHYQATGNQDLASLSYNTHNQFLDAQLSSGIISTLALILLLALAINKAYNSKNLFGVAFLLVISEYMFVENIFARLDSVVIFSLFYGISCKLNSE